MARESIKAFLAMPYGQNAPQVLFWNNFEEGVRRVASAFVGPRLDIITARADPKDLSSVTENVKRTINACDFTIAVVTSYNPNVLWEFGYTEAQGKPVVCCVDTETEYIEKSPVLIGATLRCPYQGSGLALSKRGKLPSGFASCLRSFLKLAMQLANREPPAPLVQVFEDRQKCNLPLLVARGKSEVSLITTNLSYFARFNEFVVDGENGSGKYAFDLPMERGADIKVLALDPESSNVKYRAIQLGFENDVASFREELRESARSFYQRYKDRSNVSIRIYDELPLQIGLIVDNTVVTSVVNRGGRSRYNLHILLDITTPGARKSIEDHFNAVWGQSKDIRTYAWASEKLPALARRKRQTRP